MSGAELCSPSAYVNVLTPLWCKHDWVCTGPSAWPRSYTEGAWERPNPMPLVCLRAGKRHRHGVVKSKRRHGAGRRQGNPTLPRRPKGPAASGPVGGLFCSSSLASQAFSQQPEPTVVPSLVPESTQWRSQRSYSTLQSLKNENYQMRPPS